ncbi:lipase [Rhodococcus erythropolis]|uniref:Lipase n=1 Tax=Rhodococcus erythropolis TaxID=1833 RepID=A0A5N5E5R4_RHOER|nr:lipase [Rhodococcus erythropolis]
MTQRDRLDPESRGPLEQLLQAVPGGFNAISDVTQRREAVRTLTAAAITELAPNDRVITEDRLVPGPQGAPDVPIRIYTPVGANGELPGVFYIHGGGMVIGSIDAEDAAATRICEGIGAVVVSTEYRKAPEHPHPAQIDDCYSSLTWMAKNAAELNIDVNRIAVYGGSAGGNLTINVSRIARDRAFPHISFMMPVYPMVDDRNETPSSHEITDIGIWDREANIEAWSWFLGGRPVDDYAAPARAQDLTGLPPTFIDVGEMDLFRDEDIAFAQRLVQAMVPTEFHLYPGAYHGSENFAGTAPLSQRIWAARISALRTALRVSSTLQTDLMSDP